MKVLVVYPYSDKVLLALKDLAKSEYNEYILIGDKSLILEQLFKNHIRSKDFTIYDIKEDLEVISFCLEALDNDKADYILFDEFPEEFKAKILKCEDPNLIGNIDIISSYTLPHFLFVSNYSKNHFLDFEEKKISLLQAYQLMQTLHIQKVNVALITNLNNKVDNLEANIINMIIKDSNLENIKVFNNQSIYSLFTNKTRPNMLKDKINLFIMKNYETSRVFIDTLNVFGRMRIASLILGEYYAIDAKNMKDEEDIFFALNILGKMYNSKR